MTEFETLATHRASDMEVRYLRDGNGTVALHLIPVALADQCVSHRALINDEPVMRSISEAFGTDSPAVDLNSLVQLKVLGDVNAGNMTGGATMQNSATVDGLKYVGQEVQTTGNKTTILTELKDDRGLHVFHSLIVRENEPFVEILTGVENRSDQAITLEMLASFCLDGLSPFQPDDGVEKYRIHRFRSMWSAEGRPETRRLEEMNLERPWNNCVPRSCRFGQVGSMPVRGHFPFVAFEDLEFGVLWGAQLAEPGSWQMEIYRKTDQLSLSGGLGDRELGHWMKRLQPGEHFTSRPAALSCCVGTIDTLTNRMVRYQGLQAPSLPASEQDLPILFNDWCTTWGNPSEEKITAIADRLLGSDVRYLVMDDGWFRDQAGVQQGLGDWDISKTIYPSGFAQLCRSLRAKGFVPGVWFEFESATSGSRLFEDTKHHLHRDGLPITNAARRFLDFRDPWVHDYLAGKVIQMLKENEIGYLKTDYNDSIGIGCDGSESTGEGLRQHLEGVERFFVRLRNELPDLVIEVCSSGGHRLVPPWMKVASMGGFSDSHEGIDIPLIAANTQRMIPMRQNQIWAVLRKGDSPSRLHYSLAATFLGRMCLSGDIHDLDAEQMAVVAEAQSFYQSIKEPIKHGNSHRFGEEPLSYSRPRGHQALLRVHENGEDAFCVIHAFEDCPPVITVPLGEAWRIDGVFAQEGMQAETSDGELTLRGIQPLTGLAVRLSK